MLDADEDAFGRALMDWMDGCDSGRLLLERDDGWVGEAMRPASFFAGPDDWPAYERWALDQVPPEGRVLDVGCGAGRHALQLERNGHRVVAIDHSPGAVEVCRRRGLSDVRLADVSALRVSQPYDAVLMMCGNLGIGGGPAASRSLLRRLRELVRPGAVLVGDTVDVTADTEPSEHRAYYDRNRQVGLPPGLVRIRSRYGRLVTPWFELYNVTRDELADFVDGTGWRLRARTDGGADYAAVFLAE